jgi:hypothetical protein
MLNLNEIDGFAQALIDKVNQRIYGRMCDEQHNCNYLAWAIAQAGPGDHLEIGTLHGGSAILAVLVKNQFGLAGNVVCVDPLDGYYIGTPFEHPVDWVSNIPVTPETLAGNISAFGLDQRISWVQAKSIPWPEELGGHTFASAYIDGDHWGEAPLADWLNVRHRVGRMIVFDNVDMAAHPAVCAAVAQAKNDPQWKCVLERGITAVFERVAFQVGDIQLRREIPVAEGATV